MLESVSLYPVPTLSELLAEEEADEVRRAVLLRLRVGCDV